MGIQYRVRANNQQGPCHAFYLCDLVSTENPSFSGFVASNMKFVFLSPQIIPHGELPLEFVDVRKGLGMSE
jgi:hypothetical protein